MKKQIYLLFLLIAGCFVPTVSQAQNQVSLKSDSGQSIPDTLLFRLQKAQAAITQVNAANTRGYGSAKVRGDLDAIRKDIWPIAKDLSVPGKVPDPKTLSSYNLILNNSQQKLNNWQQTFTRVSNDLQKMSKEVVALSNDTLLKVNANDTTAKNLYARQLIDVKLKLQRAGKANAASLDTVSRLLADVSAVYLQVTALQAKVSEKLEASGRSILGKESPFLWSAPPDDSADNVGKLLATSYAGQQKILGYFIGSSWDNRLLLMLAGVAFFFWVYLNYRKAKKRELKQMIGELNFTYLKPLPLVASLLLFLNLIPVFEPDAPSPYIEVVQSLLLAVLTFQFYHQIDRKQWYHWLIIVLLYAIIVFMSAAVRDTRLLRLCLVIINVGAIYIGIRLYQQLQNAQIARKFIRPVLLIYFVLHALAVLLNTFGRISLAKIFSVTAIIGLTQVIGLAVFIQLFSEALELQIKISACNGGIFTRLNISKTRRTFKRALSVVAIIVWLLVFFINLNISGSVFAFIHQLLVKPRSFGSVNFTLGNVLFFAVILYVSNLLQKHIGILFGEQSVSYANQVEHKSSKLTLIRLLIVVAGLLLAVTASGIPVDKLTVVLGALSVGIGLGMQNIVNNFVSGIILIFEKPFQIGDFVELADKKGKIQDIGIRSSKMLTPQGGQVIIPNADLISNRFVNWTTGTAYIKSEILFKVNIAADIALVTKIVREELERSTDYVKGGEPEIIINSIAADAVELKVMLWISSVYAEPAFKSRFYKGLITRFTAAQIKIM
ncbi:mechanosensitive ion channel family protein [Mucilaginibacter sp. NFX135]|uniref:mechanosensitive ion channel family protein n=1 Tax=Mucilaginibacter sp. NFX135 TaxID=3402687 RepID=UPI003AFA6325